MKKLIISLYAGLTLADIAPVPGTQRIMPLFKESDLVCDCYVESLRTSAEKQIVLSGKPVIRRNVIATITVKDLYNSASYMGVNIYVKFQQDMPVSTSSMPSLSQSKTYLLFLKASSPPYYDFADPFLGATPFGFLPVQLSLPSTNKLESALRTVLQQGTPDDQVNAERLLQGFDELRPETIALLIQLASSDNSEVALSAISVLFKAIVPNSARMLEEYLKMHKVEGVPVAILSLGTELGQIRNVGDLPAVQALASSEFVSIKLGAMAAVQNIRSPQSGQFLIGRLDDPSPVVRYLAVITLSEIFSKTGDYAPNMYQFDHDPALYTARWKTWWVQEAHAIQ